MPGESELAQVVPQAQFIEDVAAHVKGEPNIIKVKISDIQYFTRRVSFEMQIDP